MLSLPYSKKKRYLTGIDWMIHAIDDLTRRETGTGNVSQIVLELDQPLDETTLTDYLTAFVVRFPVLRGEAARDLNLCPYWRLREREEPALLRMSVHRLEEEPTFEQVLAVLEQGVNQASRHSQEYFAFQLVNTPGKSFLAMRFDHRLFDARGAEAFLGMFQTEYERGGDFSAGLDLTRQPHLSRWMEKFRAGRRVNRALLRLAENPTCALPLPDGRQGRGFRFRLIPFDDHAASAVVEAAYDQAGYLMLMPYTLAIAVRVLHRVFAQRRLDVGDYVIPVSIDLRSPERAPEDAFFNHLSFLFFRVRPGEVDDFPALISLLKEQMYEQVQSGLPRDLGEASQLMRIAPLWLLRILMRLPLKGQLASFCFASVGEAAYDSQEFMGLDVRNMFHMPRLPVPPGLGVFLSQFRGRLNVVLSYLEGILTEEEADSVAAGLRAALTAVSGQ